MDLRQEGKILYISSVDISLPTGPGVNEREFVLSLGQALGARAHFVIPQPQRDVVIQELQDCNVTFTRPYTKNPVSYWRQLEAKSRSVNQLIQAEGYDLLVFRLGPFPLVEARLARRNEHPYAVKTLGAGILYGLGGQPGEERPVGDLLSPLNRKLVRNVAIHALAIDTPTPKFVSLHREKLNLGADQIAYVENATNTDRFQPVDRDQARANTGLSQFDPIVGYVGGKPWLQGGRQIIAVLPRLLEQHPALGLVMVGDGVGMDELRDQARDLGVADHCVFPGKLPYESVPEYVNTFDVGISLPPTERHTHYGNSSQKVRQYVACGKPVVSGPGGNAFLVEEDLGSIVDSDDLQAVFESVSGWLRLSGPEREAHSLKATAYARKHLSVEKTLEERLEFWSARLTGRKQPVDA